MEKIDLFDLIESYLNNELPEDSRREVEQRMEVDEAFRQEVALHQGLKENYSDPGRWRLRSALSEVMKENPPSNEPAFKLNHSSPKRLWIWIVFFVIALIGIVVWYFLQPNDHQTQEPVENQPANSPSITIPGLESDSTPGTAPKENVLQKQKPAENLLMAEANPADFIPNPAMEALVSSGARSFDGFNFRMKSPTNESVFTPDNKGETHISFIGVLEDVYEGSPPELVLAVFNNREATQPLLHVPLELKKESSGLAFAKRQHLKFPQGLYYLAILQEGEIIYVGKFTIGNLKK